MKSRACLYVLTAIFTQEKWHFKSSFFFFWSVFLKFASYFLLLEETTTTTATTKTKRTSTKPFFSSWGHTVGFRKWLQNKKIQSSQIFCLGLLKPNSHSQLLNLIWYKRLNNVNPHDVLHNCQDRLLMGIFVLFYFSSFEKWKLWTIKIYLIKYFWVNLGCGGVSSHFTVHVVSYGPVNAKYACMPTSQKRREGKGKKPHVYLLELTVFKGVVKSWSVKCLLYYMFVYHRHFRPQKSFPICGKKRKKKEPNVLQYQ